MSGGRTRRRARLDDLVVFAGPSLTESEARALAPCRVLPPARQGDVWRALARRPVALALIDGVFESQPSVWHHELLAALGAGVAVFGASSMGALRAAELWPYGMVGVGTIYRWVRDGIIVDDSEVALLHAGAEHGHRALTLPLVNVRHAAGLARAARVLTAGEARALVEEAGRLFYQERTWPAVLEAVARRWPARARARWDAWAARGLEDLKQRDARECVAVAAEYVAAHRPRRGKAGEGGMGPLGVRARPSALVRGRRLLEAVVPVGRDGWIRSGEVLARLAEREDAEALSDRGLTRALLAGWARELGLSVSRDELAASRRDGTMRSLVASGLDPAEAERLLEDVTLERKVLDHARRLLADGPSREEALAAEARLRGLWVDVARALAPFQGRSPDEHDG